VQQRCPAHHAVAVDQRVADEAGPVGRVHQHRQIGGVARAARQVDRLGHRLVQLEGRVRQHAGHEGGFRVGVEVVPENGRATGDGVGEQRVPVDLRFELVQLAHEVIVVLRAGQLPQQLDIDTLVALGEQHVERHDRRAVAEQVVHQSGEFLARERPVTEALQAGLVDGDDDDAVVYAARRGQPHAGVVQQVFDLVDVGNGVLAGDVRQHPERRHQPEHRAREVAPGARTGVELEKLHLGSSA